MPGIFTKPPVIERKENPFSVTKEFYDSEILSVKDINSKNRGICSFSAKEAFGSF